MNKKKVVQIMVSAYCKGVHKSEALCSSCSELLDYANDRISCCNKNNTCDTCKTHCYKMEMRNRIVEVMKYSGPRMIYKHPILVIKHMINRIIK